MHHAHRLLVLASLALALPCIARAQTPAERAALDGFRDSLARVDDPAALAALLRAPGTRGGDATARLRQGFVQLRLGELQADRAPLDAAVLAFEEAARRRGNMPYAWFGLGLADFALHRGGYVAKATAYHVVGLSNYEAFLQAMDRTLERDSLFPPLVRLLRDLLPTEGDRLQPAAFTALLERAVAHGAADPALSLVLGRVHRGAGRANDALADFDRYLAQGGDSGVAALERARVLDALGRPAEATQTYLDGLSHAGAAGRALYRADLGWIAADSELAAFDRLPSDSLLPWVQRFWARRDAEAIREPGERLAEHLRRWNYVYAHFRVVHPERRTQFEKVRGRPGPCTPQQQVLDDYAFYNPSRLDDARRRERLLDDRAVVYMRHGAPEKIVWGPETSSDTVGDNGSMARLAGGGTAPGADEPAGAIAASDRPNAAADGSGGPAETWLYWFEGRPRLFHFSGSGALGPGPTTLRTMLPMGYLYALATLDGRYRRIAFLQQSGSLAYPGGLIVCHKLIQDEFVRGRQDVAAAVTHDSHTLLFTQPLAPVLQTFAVGRVAAGDGRLLLVFAAPGTGLVPDSVRASDGRLRYTLALRAVAIDSVSGAIRRLDTVRTFLAADTLRGQAHLGGFVELPVPAGRWEVRLALSQPGTGIGAAAILPRVTLAAPDAGRLALSDLVTGRDDAGLVWPHRGDPVPLNPLAAWPTGGAVDVWYELDGAVPGRSYRTAVELQRAGSTNPRDGVRLAFDETAAGSTVEVRRTLGLAALRRGQYWLTVRVTEAGTGRSAERRRLVSVVGR